MKLLPTPVPRKEAPPIKSSLKITDPSGKSVVFQLDPDARMQWTLGSDPNCELSLPYSFHLARRALSLEFRPFPSPAGEKKSLLWASVIDPRSSVSPTNRLRLGGLHLESCELPYGISFHLGELELTLLDSENSHPWRDELGTPSDWRTRADSGQDLLKKTRKAAAAPLSVYIQGETGTGKELIAQSLHQWSPRKGGPFVALNCGALPLNLAESELFGHKKGAFTGADSARTGALAQAHGGTLFLDEIADLSLDIQVKLLRFLENGEVRSLGSDHTARVNVRVICASHRPLSELVREGQFRQDLFYRLTPLTLRIPPLRDRPEDIDLLARRFASQHGFSVSYEALLILRGHAWPGNVRELRHAIERACAYARPLHLTLPALSTPSRKPPVKIQLSEDDFAFLNEPESLDLALQLGVAPSLTQGEMSFESAERATLVKALRLTRGNRSEAARLLKVSRSTIFCMIKRHGIRVRTVTG